MAVLNCQNEKNGKKCLGKYVFNPEKERFFCDACGSEMNERFFQYLRLLNEIILEKTPPPQYRECSDLTDTEKDVFIKACALYEKILSGLKQKGLIRKNIKIVDAKRLGKICDNSRFFGLAFNEALSNFKSFEELETAIKNEQEPFVKGYSIYSHLVGNALYNFEALIKTSFVFIVKDYQIGKQKIFTEKMTLSAFIRSLKIVLPMEGKELDGFLDVELRNTLAHGTFWFENGQVFLCQNSRLDKVVESNLSDFWWRTRRINLISNAFIQTLVYKAERDFFIA